MFYCYVAQNLLWFTLCVCLSVCPFRLWQVGKLDQVNACACLSAHVSKLSVLISAGMGVDHPAPSFTRGISVFLAAIAITNGLLLEYKMNSTKVTRIKF